ncbi:MAG TPA: hypothetical protein VK021_09760 [Flavobacteriaceae bacterium]|nr:hypothetical protein [Flavobacteriaceae bacterium]
MFVSFSVISEVVNRIIRIEHGKYKENTGNKIRFKPYRNSPEGEEALSDIYLIFREMILPQFEFIPQDFNKEDVEDFLHYDELDFNDKAIQNICQQNDFVLLTNDIDFRESNVDIISGHPAYFK